jgi:branched-chain amino acid transport system permease protein
MQTITNVLILASMYILATLGFVFLFNRLGVFNLSHGSVYMVSGYIGYFFIVGFGLNKWLALVIKAIINLAGLEVFLEKLCFRPFVGDFNRIIMICAVITVCLTTTVNILAGTTVLGIPAFIGV